MKNLRFWQKTYLLTLLLFLVALFGGITFIGWQNQQQMMRREMEKAKSEQHFIAQNLSRDLATIQSNIHFRIPALVRSYGQYYAQDGVFVEVRQNGEVLFGNLPAGLAGRLPQPAKADTQYWTTQEEGGVLYSAVASRLFDGFEDYTLVCVRSLGPLTETWSQMRATLTIGGIAVSLLLAVGLFFVLRRIVRPLEEVAGVADQFAAGDFGARAVSKGNDEIGNLARSFNAMADAAERDIAAIREIAERNERMAANLSHEIRTPLTAIQGYAQYMLLAALGEGERISALQYIVEESARLQEISQRMLQLASLGWEEIALVPLRLEEVVERVALSVRPKAEAAGVTLAMEPIPEGRVLGDAVLLESLLTNLLDNAIKACSPNGVVTLTATKGDECTITIADNGCGLATEELQKLGEPFYRPDKARSRKDGGFGLGVALCYQIAALHGAALQYSSAPQKGTTVTLSFTVL